MMRKMTQMVTIVLIVMAINHVTSADPITELAEEEWELFKLEHHKSYENIVEERFRMKIFMQNKLDVIQHNQLYAQNLTTFQMKINHLSDMLHHEVVSSMNGIRGMRNESSGSTFIPPDDDIELPSSVDWRMKNAVTPVKDQGQCGSCWAFSAVGSLEGQHARKTGHLVSLSEQDLVDCCNTCHGCNGGFMTLAYQCIQKDGGINTEGYYPYTARDGRCKFNRNMAAATVSGYANIIQGSEVALKKAVALVGPIAVAIDAGDYSFMHYSSGIYYAQNCSSTALNHGVLLVGYGTEYGRDYWLVKNSWSSAWGLGGYIKMARNWGNMCGIASMASFPLV